MDTWDQQLEEAWLHKAQKMLSAEEFSRFRALMLHHASRPRPGLTELLIDVRRICLGIRDGDKTREKLWAEFLGFVTPAQARSVFHQDWNLVPQSGRNDEDASELPLSPMDTRIHLEAPSPMPANPSSAPRSDPKQPKYQSTDSLEILEMQTNSPVDSLQLLECDISAMARTSWQPQPFPCAMAEQNGPVPGVIGGSLPVQAPLRSEDCSRLGYGVGAWNESVLGWWPLTTLPLQAAFEMMKLATQKAAPRSATVPINPAERRWFELHGGAKAAGSYQLPVPPVGARIQHSAPQQNARPSTYGQDNLFWGRGMDSKASGTDVGLTYNQTYSRYGLESGSWEQRMGQPLFASAATTRFTVPAGVGGSVGDTGVLDPFKFPQTADAYSKRRRLLDRDRGNLFPEPSRSFPLRVPQVA